MKKWPKLAKKKWKWKKYLKKTNFCGKNEGDTQKTKFTKKIEEKLKRSKMAIKWLKI